jgi:Fic family protein
MSFIEIKRVNDTEYISFVKKFSFMGNQFRIKEHIGKNISTITAKEYLRKHVVEISRKEFELRKVFLERLDLAYDRALVASVELRAIEINNLLEAKDINDVILIEYAKEFIFNSNNIEGSKIPAREVKKIIETGSSRYRNRNEIKEVYNSIEAMTYLRTGFKFNIPSIKRLYYIVTKGLTTAGGDAYPHGFKSIANVVNNQATVPPENVEQALSELLRSYRENKKTMYPPQLAFDFNLQYEYIHPFLDANGRTGRLIMNKILMDHGYFPMIVYAKNSRAYYGAIAKGLQRNTKQGYYQVMLEQTKKTYDSYFTLMKEY